MESGQYVDLTGNFAVLCRCAVLLAGHDARYGLKLQRYARKNQQQNHRRKVTCRPVPEEAAMFGKIFDWLKIPVAEVPDDIAVCEFECSRAECRLGDWQCCEQRLQASAPQQHKQDGRRH